jgi:hypothetical protein
MRVSMYNGEESEDYKGYKTGKVEFLRGNSNLFFGFLNWCTPVQELNNSYECY